MNPDINKLQSYPFEKLATLLHGILPPAGLPAVNLAIGEPKHTPPAFIAEEIITHLHGLGHYPATRGSDALRLVIADWLQRRYTLPLMPDPEQQILPVNGTREALFAIAQATVDRNKQPLIMMPNPFYQIYEGAALLAGAEPYYLNTTAATGWLPDFDAVPEAAWQRCQMIYLCTPANPTGVVMGDAQLATLIQLAERYDFIIAADECYAEIYLDEQEPPPGLLQAAIAIGNTSFRRCLVFHSLSKRSSVHGLRSGFVAGDTQLIKNFLQYRTYHGCAMAPYVQAASTVAWNDESHVRDNRRRYREKFAAVCDILTPTLDVSIPAASFYLWTATPGDDTLFARELYARQNITVLPGSYLSRTCQDCNPGHHHVRIALVAGLDECTRAAKQIRDYVTSL